MNRYHSYISSAVKIIESYNGTVPFPQHLKRLFSAEKKYGSKDRKMISALCFAFFRVGKAMNLVDTREKILAGLFLTSTASNDLLHFLKPELNTRIAETLEEKLKFLKIDLLRVFPFYDHLSELISWNDFILSYFIQPALYLRVRPGRHAAVLQKLDDAAIQYRMIGESTLQLANATKTDTVIKLNREAVIQDINSQKVLDFPDLQGLTENQKPHAWDCCAASGGKSILLFDKLKGNVRLTVSDIRENILLNLKERLEEAGISINKSFVADLSKGKPLSDEQFDIILCDAPCTGSGTWSRTPEQLSYFKESRITEYASLQKTIVKNAIPALSDKGLLFYITCSVFKQENEEVVSFIEKEMKLKLLHMEYLKGYSELADTLFVSVFRKISA